MCINKYQEGLKKVSAPYKANLWSLYLDTLVASIDSNEELDVNNKLTNASKATLLKEAFKEASEAKCLSEKYYIKWLDLVTDSEALGILETGTSDIPQSVDLWKLRLGYTTLTETPSDVDKIFHDGIKQLQGKSLPLWYRYIRYYKLLKRNKKVQAIYQDGSKQWPEVAQVLKPQYIEWLYAIEDMKIVRQEYKRLAEQKPYCKELHITMSKLESMEIKWNFDKWIQVHELACQQLGKEDIDVWINYALFFRNFHQTEDMNAKLQSIYNRAVVTLMSILVSGFKEKYLRSVQSLS